MLCRGISLLNESNPKNSVVVLVLPDLAKDSSPRGLWDEERQIFEELYSLGQVCEHRWIECFARESRKAEVKSNSRRFGSGRLIVSANVQEENPWLQSELCIFGRTVGPNETEGAGAPLALLPKTASLLIPGPFLPKDSVRIAERLRPSNEQVCAQKGHKRLEMLLTSLLRGTSHRAVLCVNLTGYVEDLAVTVANLRMKKAMAECKVNLERLYYLSVHTLDAKENVKYATSRVHRDLLDLWIEKKFSYGGLSFDESEPALSDEEKSAIEGHQYLENLDNLDLQVLVKSGAEYKIHPDQLRQWEAVGGDIGDEFAKLKAQHEGKYQTLLKDIVQSSTVVEDTLVRPADESSGGDSAPDIKVFENLEALEGEDGPLKPRCSSEVAGVEVLRGKSGSVYLMALDKQKILPKHTLVGGFGTGKCLGKLDEKQNVFVSWEEGDRTVVQIDMASLNPDSTAIESMTLYKYLILLEKQKKVTRYDVSYSEISRQVDASGDGFSVKVKNPHAYRTIPDSCHVL
ncbi:Uncharacterized protein SCF082_LOCUS33169 [Durusdinium trenchii]|uniref:Uncharacterized protein n=1 Tax=Durusdinium trenchii TaxID=1381693 RepID=A0ABP0NNS0_9DINO